MVNKYIILSNNPLIIENYENVQIVSGNLLDVLRLVRNYIHKGHRLISFPLAGSVKPNETPYKSIILTYKQSDLDVESLSTIESSLQISEKMLSERPLPEWNKRIKDDFQVIDRSLIDSALASFTIF